MTPRLLPAIKPFSFCVDALSPHEPLCCVNLIVEILAAHMPVDAGSPIAAVTRRRSIINIHHRVAVLHQEVMKHVFAKVARPVAMDVLCVASAVHEDHCGSALFDVL